MCTLVPDASVPIRSSVQSDLSHQITALSFDNAVFCFVLPRLAEPTAKKQYENSYCFFIRIHAQQTAFPETHLWDEMPKVRQNDGDSASGFFSS